MKNTPYLERWYLELITTVMHGAIDMLTNAGVIDIQVSFYK